MQMQLGRLTLVVVVGLVLASCGEELSSADPPTPREEPSPATLYLAGDGEMWVVDIDAEQAQRISMPELSAGDPPHRIATIGDRLALWGYDIASVPADDPTARPETLVKDGWIFIPAADPNRMWVGFLDSETANTARRLGELQEIDSDGNIVTRDVQPPGGAWPFAEASSGLIFHEEAGIRLWDPDTERTVRTFSWQRVGDIGPVHGDLVASCQETCEELILTDFGTGAQDRFPAPESLAFVAFEASFSPDGETIAVPVMMSGGGWRSFSTYDRRLALVNVEDGRTEIVSGSEAPPGYTFTEWSPDGTQVFMTGGERWAARKIVAYRLGDNRSRTIDVQVGDFYDVAAG